jgi:ABC-type arginine/histidine transport system permease subunit
MAAQRAAGEAFFATLNAQLTPSALRPDLAAAKAALVALMQNTSRAAATISIVNLMARSFPSLIATSCVLWISLYH